MIGMVIDLDGVPDAFEMARRHEGAPRIMIHPKRLNADVNMNPIEAI
jgi:hypothetical protein